MHRVVLYFPTVNLENYDVSAPPPGREISVQKKYTSKRPGLEARRRTEKESKKY